MKRHQGSLQKKTGLMLTVLVLIFSAGNAWSQEPGYAITPTDVYYLTKSVNDTLAVIDDIDNTFNKKQISSNLYARNVHEMVLDTVGKFNSLHKHTLQTPEPDISYQTEAGNACCETIYNLLKQVWNHIIQYHITEIETFMLPFEERSTKTPSDVFQELRRFSFHCDLLAKKKGMETDWATPGRVCNAVVTEILPAVYEIADETGIRYTPYAFPEQPVKGVRPRYVYKLLCHTYDNIADYYARNGNYRPITFTEISDCDEITPADVYTLVQVISAELKMIRERQTPSAETIEKYARWRAAKKQIVPGDVFRLIQHNFLLSKKVLKSAG